MTQTLRRLGGRQPLCGIGVTSLMDLTWRPAVASAWIADSRPLPGPCTRTWTRFTPRPIPRRPHCSAAAVAHILGSGFGVRALPPHGQATAMANAAIRANVHQSLDVHGDFGAQRAFDFVVALDHLTQLVDVGVGEIANPKRCVDSRLAEDVDGVAPADAINVRKADLDLFLTWEIDAGYACHDQP